MKRRTRTCRATPRQPGDSYTSLEAARALRISIRQLRTLVGEGLIAFYKTGRLYYFTDAHLDEYRASVEVPRTAFPEVRRIA
jgi:excisionase family DNA binding protein